MRSFPDDKLPSASITAESLSINIMCIFSLSPPSRGERRVANSLYENKFDEKNKLSTFLLPSNPSPSLPPSLRSMEISLKRDYVNVNLFIFHSSFFLLIIFLVSS